ncbi:hypothetical protein V491_00304 [Pseudogymnoascus sp. VKM F-3775]|nr:hypothetical protein V491_00304 [Pseudogymnoascus sp. VKM F-3775]
MSFDTTENTWGSGPEPIAIVGIGCRLPGESFSPSKLWDLLKDGRSAQSELPKNRFNLDAWYHPDSNRPGSMSTRGGYFLSHDEHFRQFDPSFFGINPLEAASMDPQQRKLLEVVFESFESAGATLDGLSGSKTSCFVGCFTHDVANMNAREAEYGVPYQMTGSDMTILSNRVNYVFNLKGSSLTVDTACSSSLYALHMACQSLISRDSDAAVVGGTNIILGVEQHIASVRLGVLSPTSTCHTFDAAADGFGRGEGICAIYLKRLSTALADKDPIRGVIRSTAINSNGRSQGINHPSSEDQESVIKAAYTKAGLCFEDTGYFECHGTGTKVGDPIEVTAIANVFAAGRTRENPLLLGSIKTNIGHTEGASGLASVLKALLSIENNLIPATVGVTTLNPAIDLKEGRLQVVTAPSPWPKGPLKRASINSFGYGGANAHCVVESPDILLGPLRGMSRHLTNGYQESSTDVNDLNVLNGVNGVNGANGTSNNVKVRQADKKYLLVFSAHDQPTLKKNVVALANEIDQHHLSDIAHTLACRRTKQWMRAFTAVHSHNIGSQILQNTTYAGKKASRNTTIAFAFTGQGAQWPQMGYRLIQQYPIVRQTVEDLQASLDRLPTPPEWRLLEELSKPANESRVQEAALSQPLCTAIQVAVTTLLNSWAVYPKAVVGHSSGEVAAAFAAGLLNAEEAITIAYYRGISVAARHTPGAMMAVGLGAGEVRHYTDAYSDIVVACHNSPQSVTLSGGKAAVDAVHEALVTDGVFARKLNTSNNAYHSHLVKDAGQFYQDCFESSLPGLMNAARTSDVPMYSCITGKVLNSQHDVGIAYWRKNLENPVLFTQAVAALVSAQPDVNCLIEIGPHSALAGPIRQIRSSLGLSTEDMGYLPSIIRGEDNVDNMLKLAGSLFVADYPIDLKAVNSDGALDGSFLPGLTSYQWNYEGDAPWVENRLSRQLRHRTHARHDLLGSRQLGNSAFSPEWRNRLKLKDVPWISDHLIGDDIIFPAAGYVAMAVEATTQMAEIQKVNVEGYIFQRLFIKTPLILPSEGEVETLFNLRVLSNTALADGKKWFDFSISSISGDDKWTEHAVGMIALEESCEVKSISNIEVQGHRGAESRDSSDRRWYAALSNIGLCYGPAFRPLTDIHTTAETGDAMSRINLHSTSGTMIQESRYMIHPAALDGCLQLAVIAAHNGDVKEIVKAYLPTVIDKLSVWQTTTSPILPAEGILKSHGVRRGLRSAHGASELYTPDGQQVAKVTVSLYSLEGGFGTQAVSKARQPYTRLVWQPDIDRLYGDAIRKLYPSGASDQFWITLSGYLDELGEILVLDTYDLLPSTAELDRQPIHIQKYAAFIAQKGQHLLENSPGLNLSPSERQQRIQDLVKQCGDQVPEADLIAHMSTKMGEILQGEIGALDVMLEDGRLNNMYKHGFSHLAAYLQLQNVAKLIAHKEPRLKILEIGAGTGGATKAILEALHAGSLMPQYSKYTFTDITTAFLGAAKDKFQGFPNMEFQALDIDKDPLGQGFEAETYDIVLASNVIHATTNIVHTLERCKGLLKPNGRIIIIETTRDRVPIKYMLGPLPGFWQGEADGRVETPFLSKVAWNDHLLQAGFSGNSILLDDYAGDISSNSIIVSNVQQDAGPLAVNPERLWLVYRQAPHPLVKEIEAQALNQGIETRAILLTDLSSKVPKGSRALMLAELEGPLLAEMTPEEMDAVRALFKTVSSVVWVTNGGLLQGKSPKHSLVFGIAKSIMTEQPSIRISSVDLDPDQPDYITSANLIVQHELKFREDEDRVLDTELIEYKGMVYISRYIVDPIENQAFTRQLQPSPEMRQISDNLELTFRQVGRIESFYFKEKPSVITHLKDGELLLRPTVYSIGKREAAILKGLQDAEHFHNICVGVVADVGTNVTRFKEGDNVICFSPGKLESSFIASETACESLRPGENGEGIVLSLIPYCSALHALKNLAGATSGRTVLIHEITEARHIAAVHIARLLASKTIVTFKSKETQALFHRNYTILDTCESCVTSSGFAENLKALTAGCGIDIAIAAPSSSSLPEVWDSLAKNGRLVCTGDSEAPNIGLLDPSVFVRGASLMSFDINDMIKSQIDDVIKLARRVLILLRDERISLFTTGESFDVSALPEAVDAAFQSDTSVNVALTCQRESTVPIHLTYKPVEFSRTASYLLIGCLGGLGRSLVTWMLTRGARHFIFLSRSGADKPEATRLVRELETISSKSEEQMTVTIVRGNVGKREDVDRAISLAKSPIRGVMQQAMFLKNDLFEEMSLDTWQGVLDPKVQGSINLHEALINEPLDFFVMTSSVLGAIGASTQSNYAAANAFLDHMARHRWSMGLQACSIALGMIVEVGHVEAHPEVEEALRRNGVYGIPEDEYLKMMEVSCRRRDPSRVSWGWDSWAQSHIVTGMEPGKVTSAGGKSLWLQDNRVRNLVMAITGMENISTASRSNAGQIAALLLAAAEAHGEPGVKECVRDLVVERFSKLVLVPTEKIFASLTHPLAEFGMDSMITAEMRSWAWRELKAEIPFMALLEGDMMVSGLIDLVWDKMDPLIWKS